MMKKNSQDNSLSDIDIAAKLQSSATIFTDTGKNYDSSAGAAYITAWNEAVRRVADKGQGFLSTDFPITKQIVAAASTSNAAIDASNKFALTAHLLIAEKIADMNVPQLYGAGPPANML